MDNWKAVIKVRMDEVEPLFTWLNEKWLKTNPCTFRLGHAGRIIIEGGSRDDVFKVCVWISNRNPLGKKLSYGVIAYEGSKIAWLSYCKLCREGKGKHYEHEVSGSLGKSL